MPVEDLVTPGGKQLKPPPVGLVVLKVSQPNKHLVTQQMINAIAGTTHCNVIVLPMEVELLDGDLAIKTIHSVHNAIHQVIKHSKLEEEKK